MKKEKSLNLYEISQEFDAFEDLASLEGGEITPELEELQEQLTSLIKNKVDGFVSFIEMMKDEMAMADLRIKKAQAFKSSRANTIKRMEKFAIESLRNAKTDCFKGGMGQIKLRKPSKVLDIINEDEIPVEYLRHKPATNEIDKAELKKAIKSGAYQGEGARLVDGEQKVNLTLKAV